MCDPNSRCDRSSSVSSPSDSLPGCDALLRAGLRSLSLCLFGLFVAVAVPPRLEAQTPLAVEFVRGDTNLDGALDTADVVTLLAQLFVNPTPGTTCLAAGDVTDDDQLSVNDAIALLQVLYVPSPPPIPAPFPNCGIDPTPGALSCISAAPACPLPSPGPSPVFDLLAYPTRSALRSVRFADVDADGDLDLVTSDDGVRFHLGSGNGVFPTPSPNFGPLPVARTSLSLDLADFDGDGLLDAVASVIESNAPTSPGISPDVRIRRQGPAGALVETADFPSEEFVCAADLSGSGAASLVTAAPTSPGIRELRLRRALPAGGFDDVAIVSTTAWPAAPVAADFDRDGFEDIAFVRYPGSSVDVVPSDGAGGFEPPTSHPTVAARRIEVIDLGGDAALDLAIFDFQSQIILARGNGDGTFTDVANVPNGSARGDLAVGNIDADPEFEVVIGDLSGRITAYDLDAQGSFTEIFRLEFGVDVRGVDLGDSNGDSVLDLAIAFGSGSAALVLSGNGDGTFEGPPGFPTSDRGVRTHLADFNGDGVQDLGVVSESGTIDTFSSNGDGTFQPLSNPATSTFPVTDSVVADVDGDGDLDAIALVDGPSSVAAWFTIALGDGAGGFTGLGTTLVPAPNVRRLALADLDGDSFPDLVLAADDEVRWRPNDGSGNFPNAIVLASAIGSVVAVGDVDGDGDHDIAAPAALGSAVRLLYNDGTGSFTPSSLMSVFPGMISTGSSSTFELADLDLDSDLDLIFGVDDGRIGRWTNDGSGVFAQLFYGASALASPPTGFAFGDLDGNGIPNVVTGSASGPLVTSWEIDPNNVVLSPAYFAAPGGVSDPVLHDFDGDGDLDLAGVSRLTNQMLYLENPTVP